VSWRLAQKFSPSDLITPDFLYIVVSFSDRHLPVPTHLRWQKYHVRKHAIFSKLCLAIPVYDYYDGSDAFSANSTSGFPALHISYRSKQVAEQMVAKGERLTPSLRTTLAIIPSTGLLITVSIFILSITAKT
jgi:hypothetical protein